MASILKWLYVIICSCLHPLHVRSVTTILFIILALPAQKKVVVNSSLGVKSRQVTESSQYEEDWEAESEPNPPFPELNKTLDYAGILGKRLV